MRKDKSKCWSCGKLTMVLAPELGKDWLKCSNCGATYQPNPTTPTFSVLAAPGKDQAVGGTSGTPRPIRLHRQKHIDEALPKD